MKALVRPPPVISLCLSLYLSHGTPPPLYHTCVHLSQLFFVLLHPVSFCCTMDHPKIQWLTIVMQFAHTSRGQLGIGSSRLGSMGSLLQARNWAELGSSPRCALGHVPCVHYGVWDEGPQLPWDGRGDRGTPNQAGILNLLLGSYVLNLKKASHMHDPIVKGLRK